MVRAPCGECQSTWSLRTVAAPSQTKGLRLGCASLVQATVIGSLLLLFRCRNSCDYSVFLYHTNRIQYEDFFHKNALATLSWSVFASNIGTSVHLNGSHIPLKAKEHTGSGGGTIPWVFGLRWRLQEMLVYGRSPCMRPQPHYR